MRSSLAVIRSLGKKGLQVTAGETTRFSTGFFSKYCHRRLVYPSPEKEEDRFIEFLLDELKSRDYDVIFPVADACLKPIINNYERISRYTKIALPPPGIFLKGYNKEITLKIAAEHDIPHPKTVFYDGTTDLLEIKDQFQFPVIIKPAVGSGSRGFSRCLSFDEVREKIVPAFSKYGSMLIQEYIPNGGELGVYVLYDHQSVPRALSVQRRLRSFPVTGGPSTLRETIRDDNARKATEIAFNLLEKMQWTGVAMVEFRIDARDNIPKIMEVNPRFWGSLQLSILSGIDFPYLLYCMVMGKDTGPLVKYKEGIQCRWLLPGDILWYLTSPHKAKNFKEFMRFDIPDDILSWDDPGPAVGFFAATLRYLFDREMWNFILRR